MNVLSLFDGMSCGQIALERAEIKIDNYFASEIDKHAITVTMKNYPNTIQLGDVTKLYSLPEKIDLLMGGSPCQGFSLAGKQLNFDDPRSKLFFDYVRLLNFLKPKYFLLENVGMKKEYQDIITSYLGVEPVTINSALVSAQNRKRLYWTNIPIIEQPKDKGIFLKDIVENGVHVIGGAFRGRYDENGKIKQHLELRKDGKSNALTTVQKDSLCIQVGEADLKGYDIIKRVYSADGKSPTLTTMGGGHREPKIAVNEHQWRKLTPLECERLQTVPDNYTNHVSKTQRYKMIGNGWTVDVIAHILKGLK
jgi:DNA-cytosine methyltransferase